MYNFIWQGHTYTYTYQYKPNQTQGSPESFPSLLLTPSSFPPSLLYSLPAHPPFSPPAHQGVGGGRGSWGVMWVIGWSYWVMVGSFGGRGGSWVELRWFLAPGIDLVCPVRDFYQISLNSDKFWISTLVTRKLWCRISNFWAISLTIEPYSFLNISAYPELKEDHFGAKKSLKS